MSERRQSRAARLCRDSHGAAAIEFALVAPVMLGLVMGIFDIGQMAYAKSVLNGAVQEAARSSSLESGDPSAADRKVKQAVLPVLPKATFTTKRVSYYDFTDVGRPEKWNDSNGDGICDNSETYTDENRNGDWDEDVGKSGNGGADDVVVYTVTVEYEPVFAIPGTTNHGKRTLTASALEKNQPFANQKNYGSDAGVCA